MRLQALFWLLALRESTSESRAANNESSAPAIARSRRKLAAVLSYERPRQPSNVRNNIEKPLLQQDSKGSNAVESWVRESVVATPRQSGSSAPRLRGAYKWNSTDQNTWQAPSASERKSFHDSKASGVILFVHIAKTGGSSFDEILKRGVNGVAADCIVEKKHYEDATVPLESRYDFPNCRLISTEFSSQHVVKFLVPKARAGEQVSANAIAKLRPFLVEHIRFITLVREPFSRLLSQWRHDKYYTPRRFKGCAGLEDLVEHGASCIQAGEPAYRYQNFQSMMLGGCVWNHRTNVCEEVKRPAAAGGGFVKAKDVLASYAFVGVNEHFEASVCLFYDTVGDVKHFKHFCRQTSGAASGSGTSAVAMPHVMRGSWITKKESSSSSGRAVLDSAVLRAAVLTNELDFKLYWAAYDQFIAQVKELQARTGLKLI